MKTFRFISQIMPLSLLISIPCLASHDLTVSHPSATVGKGHEVVVYTPRGKVKELKDKSDLHSSVRGEKKIAVKVHADWCGACKISAKPFAAAAAKHPEVRALSLDADNREFRKFVKTFLVEGLPTTVYVTKIESNDPGYEDLAALVGADGKSTIVLTQKQVGSRNEDEFTKTFAGMSPTAPKAIEAPKPVALPAQSKVVETMSEETVTSRGRRGKVKRTKTRKSRRYNREAADLGFPTVDDADIM
jgi:thiol-disulfide isomerase/thioredoxin